MGKLLEWLTTQVFNDRLTKDLYLRAAFSIQKHFLIFKSLLPRNILIKLKDGEVPMNGLLLTASSDFFKNILLKETTNNPSNVLSFSHMIIAEFTPIEHFICTGIVPHLPTKGKEEIIELIKRANAWELAPLSLMCELTLPKIFNT